MAALLTFATPAPSMKHVDPKDLSIPELHSYLVGAIGPRPVAFASTIDAEGRPNLSPFSFFNVFGANPPLLIFSPARRGRDNTTKHSYHNVKAVPEVVINVVTYSMVQQTSLASTEYPEGVNEFVKAGFTPIASEKVRPFRVKESPVQFECRVQQVIETGTGGGAGNLVLCEVVMIHIDEAVLNEHGRIDQRKIDLVGRMGGHFYVRAHGDALFELAQPLPGRSAWVWMHCRRTCVQQPGAHRQRTWPTGRHSSSARRDQCERIQAH